MARILVVDDEPAIAAVVRERLERDSLTVQTVASGEEALATMNADPVDAVVLDLMLPGMDGFEVLRRLRSSGCTVPVIVLTARDEDVDKIVGLEMGADDYMIKPFNPRELSARIRAALRRQSELRSVEAKLAYLQTGSKDREHKQNLHFDHPGRRAKFRGQTLDLRPKEYDLLHFLAQNQGRVFTRDVLLGQVWGRDSYISDRTVDVHIRRLRAKLAAIDANAEVIVTEWGVGYRLAEDV
jgi:DNA-binding response OmpR family regulator